MFPATLQPWISKHNHLYKGLLIFLHQNIKTVYVNVLHTCWIFWTDGFFPCLPGSSVEFTWPKITGSFYRSPEWSGDTNSLKYFPHYLYVFRLVAVIPKANTKNYRVMLKLPLRPPPPRATNNNDKITPPQQPIV